LIWWTGREGREEEKKRRKRRNEEMMHSASHTKHCHERFTPAQTDRLKKASTKSGRRPGPFLPGSPRSEPAWLRCSNAFGRNTALARTLCALYASLGGYYRHTTPPPALLPPAFLPTPTLGPLRADSAYYTTPTRLPILQVEPVPHLLAGRAATSRKDQADTRATPPLLYSLRLADMKRRSMSMNLYSPVPT